MDKIAVVILNWNGRQMLEKYLPTVLEHSRSAATVYVADNASTDDSVDFLKRQFPEVKIITLEKNWGFAEGYNQALRQVESEFYVLLNSDVEVTRDWLVPLAEYMEAHEEVCACQPKLLSVADKGALRRVSRSLGLSILSGTHFRHCGARWRTVRPSR